MFITADTITATATATVGSLTVTETVYVHSVQQNASNLTHTAGGARMMILASDTGAQVSASYMPYGTRVTVQSRKFDRDDLQGFAQWAAECAAADALVRAL